MCSSYPSPLRFLPSLFNVYGENPESILLAIKIGISSPTLHAFVQGCGRLVEKIP